jgi:hypothetical protein
MVKFFCSKKGKIFAEIWSFGRKNALSREQSGDVVIIGLSQDRLELLKKKNFNKHEKCLLLQTKNIEKKRICPLLKNINHQ